MWSTDDTFLSSGFPGGSAVKNLPAMQKTQEALDSVPGSGRSPEGGHGNPLQGSCLENPMDRGAWWATVHRDAKSQTQLKRLNTHNTTYKKNSIKFLIVNINCMLIILKTAAQGNNRVLIKKIKKRDNVGF